MDFMSDELFDGRRIRILTLVDHFTRESLDIEVDAQIPHLDKRKTSLASATKRAKMFLDQEKRSPTRLQLL